MPKGFRGASVDGHANPTGVFRQAVEVTIDQSTVGRHADVNTVFIQILDDRRRRRMGERLATANEYDGADTDTDKFLGERTQTVVGESPLVEKILADAVRTDKIAGRRRIQLDDPRCRGVAISTDLSNAPNNRFLEKLLGQLEFFSVT
jgi:hypothetical protein